MPLIENTKCPFHVFYRSWSHIIIFSCFSFAADIEPILNHGEAGWTFTRIRFPWTQVMVCGCPRSVLILYWLVVWLILCGTGRTIKNHAQPWKPKPNHAKTMNMDNHEKTCKNKILWKAIRNSGESLRLPLRTPSFIISNAIRQGSCKCLGVSFESNLFFMDTGLDRALPRKNNNI